MKNCCNNGCPGCNVFSEFAFTIRGARSKSHWKITYKILNHLRKLRRLAIRNPVVMYLILAVDGFITIIAIHNIIIHFTVIDPDKFISGTTYLAGISLFVGAYQIWLLSLLKQADYISSCLTKLFEKDDFFKTWSDLFYKFSINEFHEIKRLVDAGTAKTMEDLALINKNVQLDRGFGITIL